MREAWIRVLECFAILNVPRISKSSNILSALSICNKMEERKVRCFFFLIHCYNKLSVLFIHALVNKYVISVGLTEFFSCLLEMRG